MTSRRWELARRVGGYGAAAAMTPYFVIKVFWTLGLLLPAPHMAEPSWRAVNAATAVLAGVGILVAIAITRPGSERIPAWLVVVPTWVGAGWLVPTVLVAPILAPAAVAVDRAAGGSALWTVEQALVIVSFVGMGVGLPVAFAAYARARWPYALTGRTGAAGGVHTGGSYVVDGTGGGGTCVRITIPVPGRQDGPST